MTDPLRTRIPAAAPDEPAPKLRDTYLAFGKPDFGDDEIEAVTRVLRSGWVGMGPETIAFENELAAFIGAPHVVTVNSCTSALFLSLVAHGVGPGDEVICPSLTWCATANVALYLGATPVFCDVDPTTFCVSPETITAKLSPKTKAVMVVHYGGLAADVAAIRKALPASVAIIEDAAHALGAQYTDGRNVGTAGNLTCYSFYANKNLSTGEGGAIALFDDAMAARVQSLRQNGLSSDAWKRYSHPMTALVPGLTELGYKLNFIDLTAAIGRVQLRRQPEFRAVRNAIAQRYFAKFGKPESGIGFQRALAEERHVKHLFAVTLPIDRMSCSRDQFVLKMRERNVGGTIHYAPLHRMPLYQDREQPELPVTEQLFPRLITLPISASMTVADADYVIDTVADLLRSNKATRQTL